MTDSDQSTIYILYYTTVIDNTNCIYTYLDLYTYTIYFSTSDIVLYAYIYTFVDSFTSQYIVLELDDLVYINIPMYQHFV